MFIGDKGFLTRDGKDFAVIHIEGFSQKELFQKMMLGLNDIYMDVDKVVTKIEYDAITVNAYNEFSKYGDPFTFKGTNKRMDGFNYRFSFKFKEGKLRIDSPIITTITYHNSTLDERKMVCNYSDLDHPACVSIAIYDLLQKILIAAYSSSKEDEW